MYIFLINQFYNFLNYIYCRFAIWSAFLSVVSKRHTSRTLGGHWLCVSVRHFVKFWSWGFCAVLEWCSLSWWPSLRQAGRGQASSSIFVWAPDSVVLVKKSSQKNLPIGCWYGFWYQQFPKTESLLYTIARNRIIDKPDQNGKLIANSHVDKFFKKLFFTFTHEAIAISVSLVFLPYLTSSVI